MLPGATYHIFNHANGWENLFGEFENYAFFLRRLYCHVLPVAHLYAYCLMPNHFHLLVRIREEDELSTYFKIETKTPETNGDALLHKQTSPVTEDALIKKISKSFSNLFNSYAQSYNKMYDRKGSLFTPNMKREEVNTDSSFCKVVHYIHANPVHHQFVKTIDQWPYSSYKLFLSKYPTKLEREHVLDIFGGLNRFVKYHAQPIDPKNKLLDA